MPMSLPFRSVARHFGGWIVRWLEILGQNPSLAREPGLYAWSYLHQRRVAGEPLFPTEAWFSSPVQTMADDPHLNLGVRA